jgi:hypothetical protein
LIACPVSAIYSRPTASAAAIQSATATATNETKGPDDGFRNSTSIERVAKMACREPARTDSPNQATAARNAFASGFDRDTGAADRTADRTADRGTAGGFAGHLPPAGSFGELLDGDLPESSEPTYTAANSYQETILAVAADYSVDPQLLQHTAEDFYQQLRDLHTERESAKKAAREITGLNARDIARLENSYHDCSSAFRAGTATGQKMKHLAVAAREIARNYPELGIGDPDRLDVDFAAALWPILREGRQPAPIKNDRHTIERAAQYLHASDQWQTITADDDSLAAVPF